MISLAAAIRDHLSAEPCDLRATTFDLPSDRSTIAVDAGSENFIVSSVACCRAFDPLKQTAFGDEIAPGDMLVMQGNLTAATTNACLRAAREKGCRRVLNVSPLDLADLPELGLADLLVVNRGEAEALAGTKDVAMAAAALAARCGGTIVITLGADGCLALEPTHGAPLRLPAPRVAAVDASGAGDVFCGCLAAGIARGMKLHQALDLALAAAAVAVTRPGTLASCPTMSELAALIEQLEFS